MILSGNSDSRTGILQQNQTEQPIDVCIDTWMQKCTVSGTWQRIMLELSQIQSPNFQCIPLLFESC